MNTLVSLAMSRRIRPHASVSAAVRKLVLLAMAHLADADGMVRCSNASLRAMTGLDERTVRRAQCSLRAGRLVRLIGGIESARGGAGRLNQYQIVTARLQQLPIVGPMEGLTP